MPRLLRDSPLNSIWEGSGNVSALDVLRAIVKEPEGLPAFLAECELGARRQRRCSTPTSTGSRPRSRRTRSSRRAAWSRTSRSRSRRACSCATRRPRWRTRSAPARLGERRRAPTARCRRASTPRRSSTARWPLEHARYEVTGRVARITLDRPERGNGITLEMPRELAECVERANLDPAVHVIALAGRRQGLLRRLRPRRVRRGRAQRRRQPRPASRTRPGLGPGGRLADDEPQRARLHEPVPLATSRWSARCTASAWPAAPTWRSAPTCS